jgi:hypothetical protein
MNKNSELFGTSNSSVNWLQPECLDSEYPRLIGNNTWPINYANIERMLWESKVRNSQRLLVDSETADLLQRITAELPDTLKSNDMKRLRFLVEQSLPGKNGEELANLVNAYYLYQKEYQINLNLLKEAKGAEKLSRLKLLNANNKVLQTQHFGVELAALLFKKKNITTDYLNYRLLINMDTSLSSAQKRNQLLVLKENYEKNIAKQ